MDLNTLFAADPSFGAITGRLMAALEERGLVRDEGQGVARTLVETFSREIATLYEALARAHAAGFLDTATGESLDQVVALLGVERGRAGRLVGRVVLSRATPSAAAVVVPVGFRVCGLGADGKPLPALEVLEEAELARGERSVTVRVAEAPGQDTAARAHLPAHAIRVMPRPLLGIEQVDNPEPITRSGVDEDDASLRARARSALRVGERSTAESLAAAAREAGASRVTVRDAGPGRVVVRVADPGFEATPERIERVQAALRRSKAAGVGVELELVRTVLFAPAYVLVVSAAPGEWPALLGRAAGALADMVNALEPGEAIRAAKAEAALLSIPGVQALRAAAGAETRPIGPGGALGDSDLGARAEPGGWRIGPMERAFVDLDRLPPRLTIEAVS